MNRGERRRHRKLKIKERLETVKNLHRYYFNESKEDIPSGKFSNNSILNKYASAGCSRKLRASHSHATYRHKGSYGKSILYTNHDQKQVDDMNMQEKDYINGE